MPTTSAGTASAVWSFVSSMGPGFVTSKKPLHAERQATPASASARSCDFRIGISRQRLEGRADGEEHGLERRQLVILAPAEARAGVARIVRFRIGAVELGPLVQIAARHDEGGRLHALDEPLRD